MKAYLKLDKMPNSCGTYNAGVIMFTNGKWYCTHTKKILSDMSIRHPQCPLQPIQPLEELKQEILHDLEMFYSVKWEYKYNKFVWENSLEISAKNRLLLQQLPLPLAHKITTFFTILEQQNK